MSSSRAFFNALRRAACLGTVFGLICMVPAGQTEALEIRLLSAGPSQSDRLTAGERDLTRLGRSDEMLGQLRLTEAARRGQPARLRAVPAAKCNYPWSYSRRSKRCVCQRKDHRLAGNRCVVHKPGCTANAQWDVQRNACTCDDGYEKWRGRCLTRQAAAAARAKADRAKGPWATRPSAYQVQRCLREAGYLKSYPRRRMTAKGWSAFWLFKQDYDVGKTPDGIRNIRALKSLFPLCPNVDSELARRPDPAKSDTETTASIPQRPTPAATGRVSDAAAGLKFGAARPVTGCLPDRLYDLVIATYGPRANLERCRARCLPVPDALKGSDLGAYEKRHRLKWCRSCIEVGANIPLEDILRIERRSNVEICARPPKRLPRLTSSARSMRLQVAKHRSLYKSSLLAVDHSRDFAVIIGNGNYRNGIDNNPAAHGNASAFYSLLTEAMGLPTDNIMDLRDAKLDDLARVFGTDSDPKGTLWKRLAGRPNSRVFVYFAGHGVTNTAKSESYLLPADSIRHREDRTGYALSTLYANLAQLKARATTVFLEAGFGDSFGRLIFAPNLPEQASFVLPRTPSSRLTVLAAAEGDQKPLYDPHYGLGLFTRYLIEGLSGRADSRPEGNGDRRVDAVELYAFVANRMELASHKSFGLMQRPAFSRQGNLNLGQYRPRRR